MANDQRMETHRARKLIRPRSTRLILHGRRPNTSPLVEIQEAVAAPLHSRLWSLYLIFTVGDKPKFLRENTLDAASCLYGRLGSLGVAFMACAHLPPQHEEAQGTAASLILAIYGRLIHPR